jgi:predicted AAA+ superfamily ATPase
MHFLRRLRKQMPNQGVQNPANQYIRVVMNIADSIYTTLADIIGLSLFSGIKEHPLIIALRNLLEDLSADFPEKFPLERTEEPVFEISDSSLDLVHDWASFTEAFVQNQRGNSFYVTLAWLTLTDDNPYTRAAENQEALSPLLSAVAKTDLSRLGRIAAFDIPALGFQVAELLRKSGLDQLAQNIEEESRVFWAAEGKKTLTENVESLFRLFPENTGWGTALSAFTDRIRAAGAGDLGQYGSFYWAPPAPPDAENGVPSAALTAEKALRPALRPDPVRIAGLFGYEEQRSVVIANTLRLLEGKPANNILLYGDRGTGKSATVKAVCNEYAHRGLRLLEVRKFDLFQLPDIMDTLASRSPRFVVFIDDLSFEDTGDSFTGIKGLLEGGLESRPANVVIYATSNRRHLVKERRIDPSAPDAEVRGFDALQEQCSLADRFGITLIYSAPGQEEYLAIAEGIAQQRGLLETAQDGAEKRRAFRENAIRWERWFNGRSPRTAVQYVDWVAGGGGFPWE